MLTNRSKLVVKKEMSLMERMYLPAIMGGIVITIKDELGVPIKLVGTGEKAGDIEYFDPQSFVDGLFD